MISTSDKVARATHELCATVKEMVTNEVTQMGADPRMEMKPGQVERINLAIEAAVDTVYFNLVDSIVQAAKPQEQEHSVAAKAEKFVKKLAKK